jgi:hypothetical protein
MVMECTKVAFAYTSGLRNLVQGSGSQGKDCLQFTGISTDFDILRNLIVTYMNVD